MQARTRVEREISAWMSTHTAGCAEQIPPNAIRMRGPDGMLLTLTRGYDQNEYTTLSKRKARSVVGVRCKGCGEYRLWRYWERYRRRRRGFATE